MLNFTHTKHPCGVVLQIFNMAAMESPDSGMKMVLCANQISTRYPNPRLKHICTPDFVAPF